MKKIALLFACIILAVSMLAGCGAKEPEPEKTNDTAIVGNWKEDYFESGFVFNADGTGTDTFWDLTFTYTAYDGELTLIYDDELYGASQYDYTISGSKLSLTRKDTDGAEQFEYEKAAASSQTTPASSEDQGSAEGESDIEGGADDAEAETDSVD